MQVLICKIWQKLFLLRKPIIDSIYFYLNSQKIETIKSNYLIQEEAMELAQKVAYIIVYQNLMNW